MESWELKGKKIQIIKLVAKDGFCTIKPYNNNFNSCNLCAVIFEGAVHVHCTCVLPFSLYLNIDALRAKVFGF